MGDLGKLIVVKGCKNFPKVQKIAQSGHTASDIKRLQFESSQEFFSCVYLLITCKYNEEEAMI